MKTLLIPTTFQNDTIDAVKAATNYANGTPFKVVLMQVSDVQETFSASSLLRSLENKWTNNQENVLDYCRELVAQNTNCKLQLHNQFGVSSPLIKNLLDFHDIELVIIPTSFAASALKIHQYCNQILANNKCPILHINNTVQDINFSNAIYLENEKSSYPLANVQQIVEENFSLKIVSQATIPAVEASQEIVPLVAEAIAKNDVHIIVETRTPKKIRTNKAKKYYIDEAFGLPVLSIYEEAYS